MPELNTGRKRPLRQCGLSRRTLPDVSCGSTITSSTSSSTATIAPPVWSARSPII